MDLDYELYAPSYRLPCISKRVTFCMGHIINDLSSTVYYNFVLLYLMYVAELNVAHVGYIVLFGQVVTAVASVTVDKVGSHRNAFCCCYTRRKSWHLIGTLLVAVGFLFMFMPCIGCSKLDSIFKTIYYGGFILFFQLGWSFVQSSHLRLIPEITRNQHERIELNAIRYTISLVGQIAVFVVFWLLISLSKDGIVDSGDSTWFRTLAITMTVTGLVTAAVFHLGTNETGYDLFLESHMSFGNYGRMSGKQWLKEPQFYQIIFLHLFTRISSNVAIMYLPLYISQTLLLNKVYLVVYPFAAFMGSAFIPFLLRPLARCSTPKITYAIGALLVMGVAVWAWFIKIHWPMYELQATAMVILLGAGGAVTTMSSLTMAQHLIGDNTECGSVVYSSMGVIEKVMTGVAVLVIQQLNSCLGSLCEMTYYRYVFSGVVGGAAAVGFLILLTLLIVRIGHLRYSGVLVSATSKKSEDGLKPEEHMDFFYQTPNEDCFNYWSCLSSTRETEAHSVAIIYSSPHTLNRLQASLDTSSSINSGPYDVPGMRRAQSYETMDAGTPTLNPGLRTSISAPSMSVIEYSGNHEKHHRRKNTPRQPISTKDTAQLLDNEEHPELTEGLPTAALAGAAAAVGPEDPSATSVQADVHPIPQDDIYAGQNGDTTANREDIQGSPYDNVPITVTPGGKIIDNESNA